MSSREHVVIEHTPLDKLAEELEAHAGKIEEEARRWAVGPWVAGFAHDRLEAKIYRQVAASIRKVRGRSGAGGQ